MELVLIKAYLGITFAFYTFPHFILFPQTHSMGIDKPLSKDQWLYSFV